MRYLVIFMIGVLASCDQIAASQASPEMRSDIQKATQHFCKGQAKQVEISRKINALKEKGQQPGEAEIAEMDDANKDMEAYTKALQEVSEKYKGEERVYAQIIKEEAKKCKY